MEQQGSSMGAFTKDEIKAAVADLFSRITKGMYTAAVWKVKTKMALSIKPKGGES